MSEFQRFTNASTNESGICLKFTDQLTETMGNAVLEYSVKLMAEKYVEEQYAELKSKIDPLVIAMRVQSVASEMLEDRIDKEVRSLYSQIQAVRRRVR